MPLGLRHGDARRLVDAIRDNGLLTFASAIAFQTLTAVIPALAVLLALLGALQLTELWTDVAQELRPNLSPAAYTVLDDAAQQILRERQLFWLTLGLGLALWSLSGAVRAMMGAMDRVYGSAEERELKSVLWTSIGLAACIGLLISLALVAVRVVPLMVDVSGIASLGLAVARWLVALGLVALAVGLTIHYGAKADQPLPWVSVGTGLVVLAWIVLSLGFGVYVTDVADYGSLFGSLAVVWVLGLYLYLSGIAFVAGIQLDALLRERAGGTA